MCAKHNICYELYEEEQGEYLLSLFEHYLVGALPFEELHELH